MVLADGANIPIPNVNDVNAHQEPGTYRFNLVINPSIVPYAYYETYADDQLENVSINSEALTLDEMTTVWPTPHTLWLGPHLHPGGNMLSATVNNAAGPPNFNTIPARCDPIIICAIVFTFIIGLAAICKLSCRFHLSWAELCVCLLPLVAMTLRLTYVLATPWWMRQYDTQGHYDYIEYVYNNWLLPPYDLGWQSYQPPLYYFLSAYWLKFCQLFLSVSEIYRPEVLQGFSLLMGNISAIVAMGIGFVLFRSASSTACLLLYSAVATLLPADIFLSSRINNDVPAYLVSLFIILTLIKWWSAPSGAAWVILSLLLCLALLCKSSLIIFVGVCVGALVFHRELPWKRKITWGLITFLICGAVSGWYAYQRISEGQPSLVGNIRHNAPGLFSEDTPASFLVFNPIRVLELVYNDTWNDAFRRRFMWEYSFRSAFFSEFRFPAHWSWVTSGLLLVGMQLVLLMLWGAYADLKQRSELSLPMWLIFLATMVSKIGIRLVYSNGGLADFRYTVFLVVPLAYFLVRGYQSALPVARPVIGYLCLLFGFLGVVFQCYIFFDGT